MSVGNKIIYNFPRPAKELVEQFRGMPVANIDDNMGRIYFSIFNFSYSIST